MTADELRDVRDRCQRGRPTRHFRGVGSEEWGGLLSELLERRDRMRRVEAACARCSRWYADGYMNAAAVAVADEVRAAMWGDP